MEMITVTPVAPGPAPLAAQTLPVDLSQESTIRALANAAESSGLEVVGIPQGSPAQTPALAPVQVPAPAPQAQPTQSPTPVAQTVPGDVPAKFLKPDGTVDVEKLQASSKQLDTALQEKVLSVEEMVSQYKVKEAAFRNLPRQPEQVAQLAQAMVPPAPAPLQASMPSDPTVIQAQLIADLNRDPIGTIVDLVKAVNSTENKPLHEFVSGFREKQRDESMKNSLAELARTDPRISNPQLYPHVLAELDSDPNYFRLKNPYKAAWNEVKERLRLGDAQTPAQPSKSASPILGGGSPPPVPSTTGAPAPATLQGAIGQMKSKDEVALVESELRRMASQAQW